MHFSPASGEGKLCPLALSSLRGAAWSVPECLGLCSSGFTQRLGGVAILCRGSPGGAAAENGCGMVLLFFLASSLEIFIPVTWELLADWLVFPHPRPAVTVLHHCISVTERSANPPGQRREQRVSGARAPCVVCLFCSCLWISGFSKSCFSGLQCCVARFWTIAGEQFWAPSLLGRLCFLFYSKGWSEIRKHVFLEVSLNNCKLYVRIPLSEHLNKCELEVAVQPRDAFSHCQAVSKGQLKKKPVWKCVVGRCLSLKWRTEKPSWAVSTWVAAAVQTSAGHWLRSCGAEALNKVMFSLSIFFKLVKF